MWQGPMTQTREARAQVLARIVADLQRTYGDAIIVIALYGSMARNEDLPFSDVELFCVVRDEEVDHSHEWVYGAGKAEVNILSDDAAQRDAALLDSDWAQWKGQFLHARCLFGDAAYLDELRNLVFAPPAAEFHQLLEEMIVGELYEWMGKLRNAQQVGNDAAIPPLAVHFVEHLAQILAIAHRHCYTTGSRTLADSLTLARRPAGYDELCGVVMRGALSDSAHVAAQIEACWHGVAAWAKEEGLAFLEHGDGCWPSAWH